MKQLIYVTNESTKESFVTLYFLLISFFLSNSIAILKQLESISISKEIHNCVSKPSKWKIIKSVSATAVKAHISCFNIFLQQTIDTPIITLEKIKTKIKATQSIYLYPFNKTKTKMNSLVILYIVLLRLSSWCYLLFFALS